MKKDDYKGEDLDLIGRIPVLGSLGSSASWIFTLIIPSSLLTVRLFFTYVHPIRSVS